MIHDSVGGSASVSTLIGAPVAGVAPDVTLDEVADGRLRLELGTHSSGLSDACRVMPGRCVTRGRRPVGTH
jgi:hypothetical protein